MRLSRTTHRIQTWTRHTCCPASECLSWCLLARKTSVVAGLLEKTEPLADGDKVRLEVMDEADHVFRDLYPEEIADALAELVGE